MRLSPNPPQPPAKFEMHIRRATREFYLSYPCQSPKIYHRKGIVARNDKKLRKMVYSLFCSWKGSVQIYKEKVTATCIWFWCIRKISQNVNKKFVLTWFRTVGSATSWRNKQCTIAKSFFSPGPRRLALPQSPSWSLEVSPSSGSPSPCPAVSKGGRSSRKGARSRSPRGGR